MGAIDPRENPPPPGATPEEPRTAEAFQSSLQEPRVPLEFKPAAMDGSERAEPGSKGRHRNSFVEALLLVFVALLLALTLKTYVAEAYEIKGRSMEPTFRDGERVVVLKARVLFGIERGDVIIFSSRDDPGKDLIKRVVGLPGDHVRINGGEVFINGRPLSEEYIKDDGWSRDYDGEFIDEIVKPDEYFVLGDNRRDSYDSRRFHGVPVHNVKGKVVVRWWPLEEFRSF